MKQLQLAEKYTKKISTFQANAVSSEGPQNIKKFSLYFPGCCNSFKLQHFIIVPPFKWQSSPSNVPYVITLLCLMPDNFIHKAKVSLFNSLIYQFIPSTSNMSADQTDPQTLLRIARETLVILQNLGCLTTSADRASRIFPLD